jgi:MAP/microtubule affinity-regulating kinase
MQVAFVMEYLNGGELLEYVLKRKRLDEEEALEFFHQITEAVSYCHRNKLIHCDLKLENILLENKESKVVKVVDFGISGLSTGLSKDAASGSLDYMAPEYFNGSKLGVHPGVDVWALGCMLYGLVCGKLPFGDDSETKIIDRICSARFEYDEAGKKLSREVRHLISKMLEIDPEQRLTVYDVLDHPWMNNKKQPELYEEEAKNDSDKKDTSPVSATLPSTQLKKNISAGSAGTRPSMLNVKAVTPGKRNSTLTVDRSPKIISNSPTSATATKKSEMSKSLKK